MKVVIKATITQEHPKPFLDMTSEEWAEEIENRLLDSVGFPDNLTIKVEVHSVENG
jgi:hypothetical protein